MHGKPHKYSKIIIPVILNIVPARISKGRGQHLSEKGTFSNAIVNTVKKGTINLTPNSYIVHVQYIVQCTQHRIFFNYF